MSEEAVQQAWVRTTIPEQCRVNARYVASRHGFSLEELYRYFLTFCLWENDPEKVAQWLAELRGVELPELEKEKV